MVQNIWVRTKWRETVIMCGYTKELSGQVEGKEDGSYSRIKLAQRQEVTVKKTFNSQDIPHKVEHPAFFIDNLIS